MAFKKKNIKKSNTIFDTIWILVVLSLICFWFYTVKSINIWWNKVFVTETEEWEIIEETVKTKKEISVLIVWRWWAWNDAPELTDTIILAKMNSEKKTVSLLSIQRDLYVNYPDKDWHWKLNSVYSSYYYRSLREWKTTKNAELYAIDKLMEKITDITWEHIDFYINVDFNWFTKIIDAIWWIEIDVKETIIDRKYPDNNWWYQTVSFQKWLQKMNWDRALKYSRTRSSTSDFDRSLRQQQVIEAVKNKVISADIEQIKKLYEVFTTNLSTDISLQDVINIITAHWVLKENYKFISSNFNDSCTWGECEKWWILYAPKRELFWGQWVALINWSTHSSLSKYDVSRKYSNLVLNYPLVSEENFEINIFNASWVTWVAWSIINDMKKYGFNVWKNFVYNAPEKYEKSIIYYNWIETSDTIEALKTLFNWEFEKLSEPKYLMTWRETNASRRAKIEIIIWKDYKNIFNF